MNRVYSALAGVFLTLALLVGTAGTPGVMPFGLGLSASPAFANSTCNSSYNQQLDGITVNPSSYGTVAWINTRMAYFCSPYVDGSDQINAWVMLVDSFASACFDQGPPPCGNWMQIGYKTTPSQNGSFFTWSEYVDPKAYCMDNLCDQMFARTYGGENHKYQVAEDAAGYITASIDGVQEERTLEPANAYWVAPYWSQLYGETHNSGDDMPGSINYKTSFTSTGYMAQIAVVSGIGSYQKKNTKSYYCWQTNGSAGFNIYTAGTC